jgi:hypothetical protein
MSDARPNTPIPDRLAAVRAQIKALETEEAALKATILADPETRTGASWLAQIKTVTQERVDLKELRAMHYELVEEYTFPVEITRIELMGITEDGEVVSARKMQKEQAA